MCVNEHNSVLFLPLSDNEGQYPVLLQHEVSESSNKTCDLEKYLCRCAHDLVQWGRCCAQNASPLIGAVHKSKQLHLESVIVFARPEPE